MDIDLLAKMVKEAVTEHDSVTLPGMGSFVAELVPASFADRGYTILPPYRRLYFSPKQGEDNYLVQLYAQSNEVSPEDATRILTDFLAEMKEVLKEKKSLVLTGLGRLRATRENHFFFVADEDLDIYPAGFGLQPISLKTHEDAAEPVAPVEAAPVEPEEVPVEEPVSVEEPVVVEEEPITVDLESDGNIPEEETSPEPEPEQEPMELEPEDLPVAEEIIQKSKPAKGGKSFWRVLGYIVAVILILAMLALLALVVLGRVAPNWLDSFLYSAEELEILHP